MSKLNSFKLDDELLELKYESTNEVKLGVICDVYSVIGRTDLDFALVEMKSGSSTPLQLVKGGERTIEIHVSGVGQFFFQENEKAEPKLFDLEDGKPFKLTIPIGSKVRWIAETDLTFAEVCYPPYEDGRYINLEI